MVKRRFSAKESTVKSNLRNTMNKIEATSLKIETDEMSGEVKVVFDRDGKRYVKRCNRWEISLDNLRAIQLSIEYLYRAVEVYGVEGEEFDTVFNSIFIGIEATPDDSVLMIRHNDKWYEILGVDVNTTKNEIINAYRALAKIHHPDVGGSKDTFLKLRQAYQDGLEATEKII